MNASLNSIYRTIWSEALCAWVAVSELVKSKGKSSGSSLLRVLNIGGVDAAADDIHRHRFKLATMAALCLFSFGAQANPMGGNVVNGSASFNTSGNTLTVTNTPGAIIHWQDFSIQQNEITRFAQQSASSAVLNRVVGGNTSQILGSLQSNGRVFLVNPNGIVFGQGATVDVAGLVATSLNLSDADFLAGRHRFTSDPNAQAVSNAGNLNAQQGGEIWLIAPNVENSGVITAPDGEILLAAGSSVELVNSLDPNLRVNITAPAGDATNVGQLVASAGRLGLFGTIVKNSGQVSADSATMQGGKIVFRSSQRTEVGGTVSSTGTTGGAIEILSSNEVRVNAGAILDASGSNGGGTILVGGDKQGLNPVVVNAKTSTVDATATIKADAIENGDGGKVIIWADDETHAHGSISAQGGANGGDGGFVETSAHYLGVAGIHVDASASKGEAGMWLLDPLNVTLGAPGSNTFGTFAGGVWTPSAPGSFINTGLIGLMLEGGTNVTITTVNAGFAEAGDINLNATISKTLGTAATLTLLAENNINIAANAGVSSTSGALNVVLHADSDGSGAGTVNFAGASTFSLLGGRVDLYYNPSSYATPTSFTPTLVSATFTPWMLVNNETNLQDMNTNLAGNYALGKTFSASTTSTLNPDGLGGYFGFAPIGSISTPFTGQFDGLDHTIDGLYINRSGESFVGLFGYTNASTIKNVWLTNVNISGGSYVGSLVGWHQGTLVGGHNATGTVTGAINGIAIGGLVGSNYNFSFIDNSSAGSAVSGANYVGGLVGTSQRSTISNSSASGTVTGTQSFVGGLVGESYDSFINIGTASGNVNGVSYVGGLVGHNGYSSNVSNSSASGNVSGTNDVGGLVGFNAFSIGTSFATGNVSGTTNVGGLVGNNEWAWGSTTYQQSAGVINNSYASTGTVTGITNVGGLVGSNTTTSNMVTSSNASGTVTGNSNVGGLVGFSNGTISLSNASGSVIGSGTSITNLGGLVGFSAGGYGTYISSSFATGASVAGAGASNVGGLVGTSYTDISNCYAAGVSVSGGNAIGGLVGNAATTVSGSYVSVGSVTGTSNYGGLVGSYTGTLTNSHYNINGVTINGANVVSVGGLYDDNTASFNLVGQYTDWLVNGNKSLNISNYASPYGSFGIGGTGIYTISNAQGLKDMLGFADNSAYTFVLTADINLTTLGGFYIPILASDFDGANFTISNLNLAQNNSDLGMFGKVTSLGSVSNLVIQNATINSAVGNQIGGLVGSNGGTITNSSVSAGVAGTVTVAGGTQVGGLVGYNDGAISNSSVSGIGGTLTVAGTDFVGGLVGENYYGSVTNSHVSAAAVAGTNSVGGLVGYTFFGSISNSYVSSAALTATGGYIGGLIGRDLGTHTNSYFDIDNVTTNGGNNVTVGGLYNTGGVGQFNDWFNGGVLAPLVIGNYSSTLVLQGDGSYGIGTQQGMKDMLGFAEDPAYNFSLTTGINLTGMAGYYVPKLAGNFNGNAFSISNLSLNLPNDDMGLFGSIVNGNLVSNLDLVNVAVSGLTNVGAVAGSSFGNINAVTVSGTPFTVSGTSNVGGMVGNNGGGTISNSSVASGTVAAGGGLAGGLAGRNNGNITNSHVLDTAVSGPNNVGGLVGGNHGSTSYLSGFVSGIITGSTVTNGSVTGNGGIGSGGIGGLVGNNFEGEIVGSYVINPTVDGGAADGVGGLVGNNSVGSWGFTLPAGSYSVSASYVSGGTVDSTGNHVGGLVGYNYGAPINASYVDSVVVGGRISVGGLVGFDGGEGWGGGIGLISDSYALNTQVTGESSIGGLIGSVAAPTSYHSGDNFDAAISSYVSGGTVTSTATISASAIGIGGLVGHNNGGNIAGSYVTNGTVVNGGSASDVGGLVGYNIGSFNSVWNGTAYVPTQIGGIISNSYVSGGTVSGSFVGGLVGYNAGGSISDSYVSNVAITGSSAGGLVGYNLSGFVSNSYVSGGSVGGGGYAPGGVIGQNDTTLSGSVSGTFWDVGLAGVSNGIGYDWGIGGSTDAGAAGLTAGERMTMTSFVGWNIANTGGAGMTWRIYEGHTAPLLTSFLTQTTVTANNASKTYDSLANSGDNGYATSVVGATLLGSIGGSSQGAVNAGTYVFDVTGLYSDQLGYDITTYTNGTLTITTAGVTLLSVTASDASKLYGTTYTFNGTAFTPVGLLGGDTIGSVTLSSAGAVSSANAGSYAITPSNAVFSVGSAANYSISYVNGTLTVTPRSITLTAPSLTRAYNGTTSYTATTAQLAAFTNALVAGDVVNDADMRYADKNAGTNKVVTFNSVAINDGNGGANYNVTLVGNSSSTIDPAGLLVTALPTNKVLGTSDPATLPYSAVNLFDPVATVLSGSLVRDPGESTGGYAIQQGSLTLIDTQNYTMTFVPGTFSILAPTVVQEITQMLVNNGTPEGDTKDEEKKKQGEQVLAEADIGNDQGSGLPDNLPVCR